MDCQENACSLCCETDGRKSNVSVLFKQYELVENVSLQTSQHISFITFIW